MRSPGIVRPTKWMWGFVLMVAAGLTVSIAAEKPAFTRNQKAFYLNEHDLNFVRPGLVFQILSASIETNGLIRYTFKITDPKGVPLDRSGIVTPGAVRVRTVVATIPRGQSLYTAYTTRPQSSTITGKTETQASFEEAQGSYSPAADGQYTYTFATRAPANFDRDATHTIAAWAQRDLAEFDLGTQFDTDTFDFVPNGGPVVTRREIVSDEACNTCHNQLSAHDNRTEVALCITCHQPQSVDPDSGNTVDFTTMIHKIHMGEELPSVQAGTPYQIIGFGGSIHDFSTVVFPADVRNCETCHRGGAQAQLTEANSPAPATTARASLSRGRSAPLAAATTTPGVASQASHYLTNPSRRACGSCHDNVNFASGQNHANLPQVSDNLCANCHIPQGELDFDLSIKGAHTVPRLSQALPGTNFEILGVTNSAPGAKPTVRFSIKDDQGNPIEPSAMAALSLVVAGKTVDFSEAFSENALTAQGNAGTYLYTLQRSLPENAQGSWAVGIEGYRNVTLLPNTEIPMTVRDSGKNKVFYFPVTDTQAVPRRAVVAQAKCNGCHYDLEVHGSRRNDVALCVLCHNPNLTDAARRTAEQLPSESVNFKLMIHKIHTGEELQIPFTVYGFGGNPFDFTEVRFPGDRRDCTTCHIDGTQQLPLPEGVLATNAPRDYIDPMPPISGACLSCHTTMSAAAHADVNTSARLGEACATCHGPQAEFSIDRVHAR